jgi:signal transduction histidine kinase
VRDQAARSRTRRPTAALWGSVRARITVVATAVVAVTLIVASLALMAAVRHSLLESQDELSKARALELAEQARDGTLPDVVTSVGDDGVAQVVDSSGHVLAASSGLAGDAPIAAAPPQGSEPAFMILDAVPDDSEKESYRVWAITVRTSDGPVSVFAGSTPESVGEAVATVRKALWIGIPVIVALFALATRLLVGRSLAPVERIRTEVAGYSTRDLGRRLSEPAGDDEIALLARTMNDLLSRLDSVSRRERQFIADASHELQSPLAAFRAQLEVAAAHPDGVDVRELAGDLLDDADRLERLTRDLLVLAKLDNRPFAGGDLVDLDVVVAEEAARVRAVSDKDIDTRAVAAGPVRGDREDLARLIRNLLDNAARHAHSRVLVSLEAHDDDVELTVSDDGPGIAEEDRGRVFERFVRLDSDRGRASGGSGLGLAIAQAVAARHGGRIDLANGLVDADGRTDVADRRVGGRTGARFVVRLPLA